MQAQTSDTFYHISLAFHIGRESYIVGQERNLH